MTTRQYRRRESETYTAIQFDGTNGDAIREFVGPLRAAYQLRSGEWRIQDEHDRWLLRSGGWVVRGGESGAIFVYDAEDFGIEFIPVEHPRVDHRLPEDVVHPDVNWLDELNEDYAKLRADPEAWAQEEAERALWDVTLADGLNAV